MSIDIKIINDVIVSLYDDYEQEQDQAQKVISAWLRIKKQLWDLEKKMSKADIKIINNSRLQILNEEGVVVCEGELYTPDFHEQLLELVINLGYEIGELETNGDLLPDKYQSITSDNADYFVQKGEDDE